MPWATTWKIHHSQHRSRPARATGRSATTCRALSPYQACCATGRLRWPENFDSKALSIATRSPILLRAIIQSNSNPPNPNRDPTNEGLADSLSPDRRVATLRARKCNADRQKGIAQTSGTRGRPKPANPRFPPDQSHDGRHLIQKGPHCVCVWWIHDTTAAV
jgi:hypothetical protein